MGTPVAFPLHAVDEMRSLEDRIRKHGVVLASETGHVHVDRMLRMVRPALADMEADVSQVDWLTDADPARPGNGAWKITWWNDAETVVTIDSDADWTMIDLNGHHAHRIGSSRLHLVCVRHVRRQVDGAVSSMSANMELDRVSMPSDDEDGRRPVHIARTLARLFVEAAMSSIDPDRQQPVLDPHMPQADVIAIATILDENREDILALDAKQPGTDVTFRRPSALSSGRCRIGGKETDAIEYRTPERLPMQPIELMAECSKPTTNYLPCVIANLSTPETNDSIGGRDAVSIMRLMRLAAPWRSNPDTAA